MGIPSPTESPAGAKGLAGSTADSPAHPPFLLPIDRTKYLKEPEKYAAAAAAALRADPTKANEVIAHLVKDNDRLAKHHGLFAVHLARHGDVLGRLSPENALLLLKAACKAGYTESGAIEAYTKALPPYEGFVAAYKAHCVWGARGIEADNAVAQAAHKVGEFVAKGGKITVEQFRELKRMTDDLRTSGAVDMMIAIHKHDRELMEKIREPSPPPQPKKNPCDPLNTLMPK
jgi:hypothetical protein